MAVTEAGLKRFNDADYFAENNERNPQLWRSCPKQPLSPSKELKARIEQSMLRLRGRDALQQEQDVLLAKVDRGVNTLKTAFANNKLNAVLGAGAQLKHDVHALYNVEAVLHPRAPLPLRGSQFRHSMPHPTPTFKANEFRAWADSLESWLREQQPYWVDGVLRDGPRSWEVD